MSDPRDRLSVYRRSTERRCDQRHTADILTARQGCALMDSMNKTPATTPANARLVGDGPSFTLGVEDRPWDDSPSAPTTVCTEWSFSTCSPIYDPETNEILPGVQCTSFRTNGLPHPADWDRHPELDKRVFPTAADARRMAYNLGVLRYFYYRSGR